MTSVLMSANSNKGAILSWYILGPCLFPPYGLTNTSRFLGRLKSINSMRKLQM
jgi:hypothetical protein